MSKKKKEADPSKYTYSQYAFRASKEEIKALQDAVDALYKRFNKGRDSKNPKGKRAVKAGDIALKAMFIGLRELGRVSKWEFESEE